VLRLLNTYTRKFVLMWPTDFYDLPVSVFLFYVKIFSIHNLEKCDLKLEKAVLANAILTDRHVIYERG